MRLRILPECLVWEPYDLDEQQFERKVPERGMHLLNSKYAFFVERNRVST